MTFQETLTAAVRDLSEYGFDSEHRVLDWMRRIRDAADSATVPMIVAERQIRDAMMVAYQRQVERGGILIRHNDIPKFTLDKVKPKLRAELDRRIRASTELIKLNRAASIEKTIQRFSGWATSIPMGGSDIVEKIPVKSEIRKALTQLPFEERRVAIDQTYKLISNVSDIIATDGGAIAAIWHDHGQNDKSYDARPEHLRRTGKVYAIRNNWAIKAGLMKAGPNGYTDQITAPGEEVYCRCFYVYLYAIRRLPDDMLTAEGLRRKNERIAA